MILDLAIGGVLIPGLLVLALLALVGTFAALHLLAAAGIRRLFGSWAVVEIALFTILFALLVQYLPTNGIFL
ncbi:MAG TPA: DUF1656 domain-containing protein [Bradyrhizobium sp.]|nr:DUF1656 domain-containing protein [Bradyrhizobium sp.]